MGMRGITVNYMTFDEQVMFDKSNSSFHSSENFWCLLDHLNRNRIIKNSDRINFIKKWFLSGNEVYVNGSSSGRIVLKYQPELLKLLKIGFIKQVRVHSHSSNKRGVGRAFKFNRYGHGQTILTINN
jgi:hypothetical protein